MFFNPTRQLPPETLQAPTNGGILPAWRSDCMVNAKNCLRDFLDRRAVALGLLANEHALWRFRRRERQAIAIIGGSKSERSPNHWWGRRLRCNG
jgi:hypothetical protein